MLATTLLLDKTKKRRKKRQSKDRKSNLLLFPFLIVVAAVIIGFAYWKLPDHRKEQIRDSYDNVVEAVKETLQDRLEKISETSEPAIEDRLVEESDEKTEPATGDRLFSYLRPIETSTDGSILTDILITGLLSSVSTLGIFLDVFRLLSSNETILTSKGSPGGRDELRLCRVRSRRSKKTDAQRT